MSIPFVSSDSERNVNGFVSFYSLPSTVTNSWSDVSKINIAYLYYLATSDHSIKSIETLLQSALIKARDCGFDVFNALNTGVLHDAQLLESLNIGLSML
jgi:hypothetical protein